MRAKFARGISWGAVKEELFLLMDAKLSGPREEYRRLMNDRGYLTKLLQEGGERARAKSVPFMQQIRKAVGIDE